MISGLPIAWSFRFNKEPTIGSLLIMPTFMVAAKYSIGWLQKA